MGLLGTGGGEELISRVVRGLESASRGDGDGRSSSSACGKGNDVPTLWEALSAAVVLRGGGDDNSSI